MALNKPWGRLVKGNREGARNRKNDTKGQNNMEETQKLKPLVTHDLRSLPDNSP